jgi:aromatic-L-amino-acid decarboxylase
MRAVTGQSASDASGDHPRQASSAGPTGDMPPEEFRRWAHEVVDWMATYLAEVGSYRVLPDVQPGQLIRALPPEAPERGESMDALLSDFRERVLPAVTHWNHPAFLSYFATSGSCPGILGEMLSAALNVNAMLWLSSPAGTELEMLATDWVRRLVGLPESFEGVINDTASTSSLYALAAARERNVPEAREEGLSAAPRCRVYASQEAHSSIDKAVHTLGFGRAGIHRVPTDAAFRMEVEELRRAIESDRALGVRPVAVVATVGTTSTASSDPVDAVARVAEEHGLWLHVDAAYAGPAASLAELRPLFAGWERADSVVLNPHKWLFTPVDCSILFCRRPETLRAAFSLTPEYLRTNVQGPARNLMDYGVALGRRFRALKLWFVLRYFGVDGVRSRLREHVRMAGELGERVRREPGWELAAPVCFSVVVMRHAPAGVQGEALDRLNHRILDRVNRSGEAFLNHTVLRGRVALRLAIGNIRTTRDHVQRAWELLRQAADQAAREA